MSRKVNIQKFTSAEPLWYLLALPYREYLQTTHWYLRRTQYLEEHSHVCERCGLDSLGEASFLLWEEYEDEGEFKELIWQEVERRERPPKFHIHHKTYENLGQENDEDLELVCAPCHNLEHNPETHAAKHWAEQLDKQGLFEQ